MSKKKTTSRKKKLTRPHKFILTTLSLSTFVGMWGGIAQQEASTASDLDTVSLPDMPPPATNIVLATASPWPTIAPLSDLGSLRPIPTIAPLQENRFAHLNQSQIITTPVQVADTGLALAPIPTLAPVPTPVPVVAIPKIEPPAAPAPTAVSAPIMGQPALLSPLNGATSGPTLFEWLWPDAIPANHGFEVLVWRAGSWQAGAHDAVTDNLAGRIVHLGNGRYQLLLDIQNVAGVQGQAGDYLWTVSLVQINPSYANLGIQAPPAGLRLDLGGGGGGGGGNMGGGHTTQGS